MESYHLVEAGITGDGVPVFKFGAKLHEGIDFDGKFNIQFAAVQRDDETRFAINSPHGLLAVFEPEDSRQLARALAESGAYIVCANYENRDWKEPQGVGMVLMGRDIGRDVDYRERCELPDEEYATVKEIADVLDARQGA